MTTDTTEPTFPGAYGLESLVLLMIALDPRGVLLEGIEDDPDEREIALKTLHGHGWELERTTNGRIRAAHEAEPPVPGYPSYEAYVSQRVLSDPSFWQSVVRGECIGRIGLYLDRAERYLKRTIEPFLKPGEDTLPPIPEFNEEDDPEFDPNAPFCALA